MVNDYLRKPNLERADPKEFDLLLGVITTMHSLSELHIRFLRRRVKVSSTSISCCPIFKLPF